MAAGHSPIEQFAIKPLIHLEAGGFDISFTNSALWMVVAVVVAGVFFTLSTRKLTLVPGRWQAAGEVMFEFIAGMLKDNAGKEGMKYFPFIFTLFIFILLSNVLGLLPYSFTTTSHIAVTGALALVVFVGVTLLGFAKHGLGYLHMFLPSGVPGWLAPMMIVIEVFSYLSRPVSLAVRLFANMTAGHVLLKVVAGFIVSLGVAGIVPFAGVIGITLLEIIVALLHAYIFAVLSCIYLNDALHLH